MQIKTVTENNFILQRWQDQRHEVYQVLVTCEETGSKVRGSQGPKGLHSPLLRVCPTELKAAIRPVSMKVHSSTVRQS
jgi:hypothetical protein